MMIKHLREPPPSLRQVAPRIASSVDRLVLSLLEKDRTKRPESLVSWVHEVRAAPVRAKNRLALFLGIAIAALAVGASYFLRSRQEEAPPPVIAPAPPEQVAAPAPVPPPIAPVIEPPPPPEKKRRAPAKKPISEDGLPSWEDE
jgi:hypothetical protein